MEGKITLSHGAGGELTFEVIEKFFLRGFSVHSTMDGIGLEALDDGASIKTGGFEIVFSIDNYTVDPVFFPGGDIGRLAVSGTINDVSMMGAKPVAILDAVTVEEGFQFRDLKLIVKSMDKAAKETGVAIISGDFKVMPQGKLDKIVIAACGVGVVERGDIILDSGAKPGDKVLVSGTIGDHGIALLSKREGLGFETEVVSDVAPIWDVVEAALKIGGVHAMKDPTRGGLAGALNEIAKKSKISIEIDEEKIPFKEPVVAAAEMLGLSPYELLSEGKAVIIVDGDLADETLQEVRKTKHGKEAEIIGEVKKGKPGYVLLNTLVGGTRILEKPLGEPIPRIC